MCLLLSLGIMFVRFSHVVPRSWSSFIFVALYILPSVSMHSLFIHPAVGAHSIIFQFGAVTSGASVNILYMSLGINLVLGSEFQGYRIHVSSNLVDTSREFSKVTALTYTPTRSV